MKVIIAGGRNFDDYELLRVVCNAVLATAKDIEIVSGGASGADALGERYAAEMGYPLKRFPADWNTHGKAAGPIRNKQMAEYANGLIAFWDSSSRGTKHMIETAKKNGLKVYVEEY